MSLLRKRIAFVFPGQGSQKVGMGRAWADASPEARRTFEEADEALGFPLSRLCWEGPEEELNLTANTQPALLAVSTAIYRALGALAPELQPVAVAGHSLGEYSALVAAGRPGLRRRPAPGAPARRAHAGGRAGRRRGHGGDHRHGRGGGRRASRPTLLKARSAPWPTTTASRRR